MADDHACVVCFHEFTIDRESDHQPIVIPCGHTYCLNCCSKLDKCPLCEKKIKKGKRTPNYALISHLSAVHQEVTKEKETANIWKAHLKLKRKQEKTFIMAQQLLTETLEESKLLTFALESQTKRLKKGIEDTQELMDLIELSQLKTQS